MPARRKKLGGRKLAAAKDGEYITPASLVRRWDGAVTLATLKNWRWQGRGPPWTKLEHQIVYPVEHLVEWEAENTFPKVPC